MFDKKNILGVGITDASKQEILEYIIQGLQKSAEKYYIVTPNPEILVLAHKNPKLKKILNNAKLASADGVGIMLASKILGKPLKERVTGADLLEDLCLEVSEKPITVGFLGGGPKIAESAAECLCKKYPGLKVVFAGGGWPNNAIASATHIADDALPGLSQKQFSPRSISERLSSGLGGKSKNKQTAFSSSASGLSRSSQSKSMIHDSQFVIQPIDILFVAFGAPKQEIWMSENLKNLPVRVAIGVGGAFDYISGKVPRAPLLIRLIGFEWLFRLIVQPWRWKRQLALLEFIWMVFKEKYLE